MIKWSMRTMILNGNKIFVLFLISLLFSCSTSELIDYPESANTSIIPYPQKLEVFDSYFLWSSATRIFIDDAILSEFKVWSSFLKMDHDKLNRVNTQKEADFTIDIVDSKDLGVEGYELKISSEKVELIANSTTGLTRGLSSIKQLIYLNEYKDNYFIPALHIKDYAAYAHRGLLLDCSRHFFEKKVILKYIDLLALYKMNVLHWHLTEDQGWRIAIDKYPELSNVGAWRLEEDGTVYGGFYTKEEIRELVSYARSKDITIIPEIELPGHSQAAIAAFPHLSCKGDTVKVANDWGVFKEIYCAGNDSVFIFLEDVLTEVMDLFPSSYIHIGGDEAPKTRWESCPKCQKRIMEEGLKDEHELQSYFIQRIQSFLHKNGRELIGWDEILEGGLSEGAIVQSWRGIQGGIHAVKKGNKAIMSPTSHAYLDYPLSSIDLEKVYSFNPIPDSLNEEERKLIIGGECNMWSEHVPDESVLDSKVFPRMLAMSEVLWSGEENKDYLTFLDRVYDHHKILEDLKVNYGLEALPFEYKSQINSQLIHVSINQKIKDIEVKYKLSESVEDKLYKKKLSFSSFERFDILGQAYRKNEKVGEELTFIVHPHKAMGNSPNYIDCMYSDWYSAGGNKALFDGVLGGKEFRDGHWQGFWGEDIEIRIDLEKIDTNINSIKMHFYQYNNSWIFIPKEVEVYGSKDGEKWISWGKELKKSDPKQRGKFIESFEFLNANGEIRFIKVKAKNMKEVPAWHEAAGSEPWLFIDEIIVQ